MTQKMNNLNFLKKQWYTIERQTAKNNTVTTTLLCLKQKPLNQAFIIILMHMFL